MAIYEYFKRKPRRIIAFYGEDPPQTAIDYLREYECRRVNESEIINPTILAQVAAVIFRQRRSQPNRIAHDLKRFAKTLLWHDCRVFVEIAPTQMGLDSLISMREFVVKAIADNKLPAAVLMKEEAKLQLGSAAEMQILSPVVRIIDQIEGWGLVAEDLRNFPPVVSPFSELDIEVDNGENALKNISEEGRILIQRAFHDCSKVKLASNFEGRSGVGTYRVYATYKHEYLNNPPPYKYFAKLGDRKQISKEYLAYRDTALEHIPFHLGPRLRLDRCELGAQQGIIVSDYVSGSENLLDCARNGLGAPVIASLFNTTLRVWQDSSKVADKSLQDYLKDRMPNLIPEHRRSLIEHYGILKEPTELQALLDTMPSKPVQIGVVHGDLHALNVLVRNGDAIVIDFEKMHDDLPLLLDLASLEAGLFVDGFVSDRRNGADLLKSIECLYEVDALVKLRFDPCHPGDGSAWFFDCVRQIRMQARQVELKRRQYALTLGIEFAKKACKNFKLNSSTNPAEPALTGEDIRALAYVLAARILDKLSRGHSGM